VRADIGDRAELAAKLGIETPVPIDGKEQPILEKAAVDETGCPITPLATADLAS